MSEEKIADCWRCEEGIPNHIDRPGHETWKDFATYLQAEIVRVTEYQWVLMQRIEGYKARPDHTQLLTDCRIQLLHFVWPQQYPTVPRATMDVMADMVNALGLDQPKNQDSPEGETDGAIRRPE